MTGKECFFGFWRVLPLRPQNVGKGELSGPPSRAKPMPAKCPAPQPQMGRGGFLKNKFVSKQISQQQQEAEIANSKNPAAQNAKHTGTCKNKPPREQILTKLFGPPCQSLPGSPPSGKMTTRGVTFWERAWYMEKSLNLPPTPLPYKSGLCHSSPRIQHSVGFQACEMYFHTIYVTAEITLCLEKSLPCFSLLHWWGRALFSPIQTWGGQHVEKGCARGCAHLHDGAHACSGACHGEGGKPPAWPGPAPVRRRGRQTGPGPPPAGTAQWQGPGWKEGDNG